MHDLERIVSFEAVRRLRVARAGHPITTDYNIRVFFLERGGLFELVSLLGKLVSSAQAQEEISYVIVSRSFRPGQCSLLTF